MLGSCAIFGKVFQECLFFFVSAIAILALLFLKSSLAHAESYKIDRSSH